MAAIFFLSNTGIIILLTIGFEPWNGFTTKLKLAATVAILLMVPISFFGLSANNDAWHRNAILSDALTHKVHELLPDPAANATLYFNGTKSYLKNGWLYGASTDELLYAYGRDCGGLKYKNGKTQWERACLQIKDLDLLNQPTPPLDQNQYLFKIDEKRA